MPVTAAQILSAIERADLDHELIVDGDNFAVAILIDRKEVARVGMLRIERPKATLSHDGQCVDVFPSPGLPDGFTIACRTVSDNDDPDDIEDASLIAEALNGCFEIAYFDLVDSDR